MQSDYNKHGEGSFQFEVITECEYEKLLQLEDDNIKLHNSFFEGYNMTQSVFQFWKTYKKYKKDVKAEKYKNDMSELQVLCNEYCIPLFFRIVPTKVKKVIALIKYYAEHYDANKFNATIESWNPNPELRLEYEGMLYDDLMYRKDGIIKDSDRKDNRYCISYRCKVLNIPYEERYEI